LSAQVEIDSERIAVLGRSAGVYFSCLLATHTDRPAAYILAGGLYLGIDDFMELIYERGRTRSGRRGLDVGAFKQLLQCCPSLARCAGCR
jgi:hypothetical protein